MFRNDRRKDIPPKYLLLALTVVCVVFLLISYFAGDRLAGIKLYTGRIIAPFQKGVNEIGQWTDSKLKNLKKIDDLQQENNELKKELEEARRQLTRYQAMSIELKGLRELYSLDESYPELHMTAAHVFSKASSSWFSEFYVDKGSDDGIFEGANVMYGEGLLGLVTDCYPSYSKVRALIDDSSKISARLIPSDALCTVEGNLNSYKDGVLIVENIDKDASVSVGDKVLTSDISDRYHPGLLIGYIESYTLDSNNLTLTALLNPACDFDNISDVLIITDKKKSIIDE